jgi:hypothetical protein
LVIGGFDVFIDPGNEATPSRLLKNLSQILAFDDSLDGGMRRGNWNAWQG